MMQDDVPEKDVIVAVLPVSRTERLCGRMRGTCTTAISRAQVLAFKFDDHIQALVEKLRKRMGRIDRQAA